MMMVFSMLIIGYVEECLKGYNEIHFQLPIYFVLFATKLKILNRKYMSIHMWKQCTDIIFCHFGQEAQIKSQNSFSLNISRISQNLKSELSDSKPSHLKLEVSFLRSEPDNEAYDESLSHLFLAFLNKLEIQILSPTELVLHLYSAHRYYATKYFIIQRKMKLFQ